MRTMLEILFKSSRDKLALMSAYIGDRLSTVPLLKAHSIILEDKSIEDVDLVVTLIQEFLAAKGQHGFRERIEGNKVVLEALADEAASWASHEDAPVDLPPGLHQCLHCGKVFSSEEEYRAHIIIHYV
jgi:hypothetical protein